MQGLGVRAAKLRGGVIVGVLAGGLAALAAATRPAFLERAEYWTYDLRARGAARADAAARDIILVDVGERDIRDVERNFDLSFPWPRVLYAYLTRHIGAGGPRAIVYDWFFQGRGSLGVGDAAEFAAAMKDVGHTVIGLYLSAAVRPTEPLPGSLGVPVRSYPTRAAAVEAALGVLSFDRRAFVAGPGPAELLLGGEATAAEVRDAWTKLAGTQELAAVFPRAEDGLAAAPPPEPRPLTPAELAGQVTDESLVAERAGLTLAVPGELDLVEQPALDPPLPILGAAARLGNVVQRPEDDGVMRRHYPLQRHGGLLYPSLPLAAWMLVHPDLQPRLEGRTLVLGDHDIPLDEHGGFGIHYHGGSDVYPHVSAYQILQSYQQVQEGQTPVIPPEMFKDKLVVVSATANALVDVRASPVARVHLGAAINATALDNLEAGTVIRRFGAAREAALAFTLAFGLAVLMVFIWTALRSTATALAATTAGTGFVLGGYWVWVDHLFTARGLWVAATVPIAGATLSTFASLLVASALERNDKRFIEKALNRYTSQALTRELMRHPEYLALGGARREISVYFSDIAGFTTMSEKLSPEHLVALLNEYLTVMTDVIDAFDGYVDKYIGDAIMAIWGGLVPDPEHARKAVRAALAMRDECLRRAPGWEARFGVRLSARGGLNSGDGVVGNMGSQNKYNYTAMGDMVNIASRLEGANKAYGTLLMISETTLAMVDDLVDVRELDYMTVKGKARPIRVFEVLAEKGKTDPPVLEAAARFVEGLVAYRERRFAAARAELERVVALRPDDGPALAYLERCDHFLAQPPPADWDGVWHMKEK